MTSSPHLVLMGLRGSGKSTVGRALADGVGWPLVDLDSMVLDHLECNTVKEVWDRVGESGFRAAEVDMLKAVLSTSPHVVALGGGTPTAPGAADLITDSRDRDEAFVVYLRCTPEELVSRLSGKVNDNRPPLLGIDTLDEMAAVFDRRDPLYSRLADLIIEDAVSVEDTVRRIGSAVESGGE